MEPDFLLRLILLLPLVGAIINGVATLWLPNLAKNESLIGALSTAMVGIPFLCTAYLFATFDETGGAVVFTAYTWMAVGDFSVDFAYRIDQLSLLMTLIVTGVGALIHMYSSGYMHGDEGYSRFFAYLNLFIFAMLNLVLGNNLLVLFLGWEGVGLCSYLLIGFWYKDLKNSEAANKAFIVNRVGDFAFLMAMFIIVKNVGSLDFDVILNNLGAMSQAEIGWVVFLLFFGATGKSAQIPLFVWLPDAMAGPTPVSALIHAATMVTSGLYLLARMSPAVLAVPEIMAIIGIVGAVTAIMAATIAIAQNDIKKVLAYSTVSQLGFMFMAAGVGAFFVAIFHVMTHAFFKACLFLGSGSVIHAMHHVEHELHDKHHKHLDPQDMRTMGGLKKYMPATARTYLISMLAISGIPGLAGFFSKDEILYKTFEYGYSGLGGFAWFVWVVGLITAALTAFYMARSYFLTFEGKERWAHSDTIHPHESPKSMTIPLWILAGLAVVAGYLGLPAVIAEGEWNWIHHYLGEPYGGPVAEIAKANLEKVAMPIQLLLIALGGGIGFLGVWFAWSKYKDDGLAYDAVLEKRFGGLYRWWQGKYFWDELYQQTIVDPLINTSDKGLAPFDAKVVDGAVNGVGAVTKATSSLMRLVQNGIVQNYALYIVIGVVLVVSLMLFG